MKSIPQAIMPCNPSLAAISIPDNSRDRELIRACLGADKYRGEAATTELRALPAKGNGLT